MRTTNSVDTGAPGATGLGDGAEPLAPVRRARPTMPPVVWQILREILLLGSMYVVYSVGRIYAAKHSASAFDNAHRLIGWERDLGLPNEAALQHSFLQVPHLVQVANAFYAYAHFPLTALVLIWLSVRRPAAYKGVRSTLMALTGLALVGHTVFPLAPPRMLPNLGWVDTEVRPIRIRADQRQRDGQPVRRDAKPARRLGSPGRHRDDHGDPKPVALAVDPASPDHVRGGRADRQPLLAGRPGRAHPAHLLPATGRRQTRPITTTNCFGPGSSGHYHFQKESLSMPTMKSVQTGAPGAIDLERPAPGPDIGAVMKGRFTAETTLIQGSQAPVPTVAFVLQGGGSLAAGQVGMLRALLEAGIRPDMVVGSSAGALNAVAFAQNPTEAGLDELQELWARIRRSDIFPFSPRQLVHGLIGRRGGLVSPDRLRALLAEHIGIGRLEDAVIPVGVVTTDAATGRPAVLSSGPALPALLASAALPGIFPPVELGGRLLVDGGVAADIPILQAEESGATTSYVLPMGAAGPTRLAQGAVNNAFLATRQLLSRITADDVAMARGQIHVLPAPAAATVNPMDFRSSRQLIRDGYDTTRSWLSEHMAVA